MWLYPAQANVLERIRQGWRDRGRMERSAPIKTCRDFNAVARSPNLIFPHETFMAALRSMSHALSLAIDERITIESLLERYTSHQFSPRSISPQAPLWKLCGMREMNAYCSIHIPRISDPFFLVCSLPHSFS